MDKVKITLIRSKIGILPKQKRTLEALGLKKINSTKIFNLNPCIEGMIKKVKHLVKTEIIKNS
ncbi:MAG: 50S ribosomal protein L30 [Bacteroidales bacterium]|nr:50S ribosomal protein L30 [Bacteroidales bacterium]